MLCLSGHLVSFIRSQSKILVTNYLEREEYVGLVSGHLLQPCLSISVISKNQDGDDDDQMVVGILGILGIGIGIGIRTVMMMTKWWSVSLVSLVLVLLLVLESGR